MQRLCDNAPGRRFERTGVAGGKHHHARRAKLDGAQDGRIRRDRAVHQPIPVNSHRRIVSGNRRAGENGLDSRALRKHNARSLLVRRHNMHGDARILKARVGQTPFDNRAQAVGFDDIVGMEKQRRQTGEGQGKDIAAGHAPPQRFEVRHAVGGVGFAAR
jgi:hypothetical protein